MYRITCPSCGKLYDALKSADCTCLQPVRSFLCPHCASCFCSAPTAFHRQFWRDAPPELAQRRRAGQERLGQAPTAADLPEGKPIVLFADDDATGRAIARQVIRNLGFGVIIAEDGEAALSLARQYKPELIITDALMPRRDGRDLARIVKEELPATKIIVITSVYKDPRYKHEAMSRFAVDEYLAKPVKPAELRTLINKYLA